MKVAIIILNWNGAKMLSTYLPSVINYSRDEAEIFAADNASTDDSMSWLSKHYPMVKQIALDRNWGFAEGYNKALGHIDAGYYILLNSDIEVTYHWLTPLIEFMDVHPQVAAYQPKLLSVLDHDQFEYAGTYGGFIDRYGYPFCRGRIFQTVENDDGQYDDSYRIAWATGACLMIRSHDYQEAEGLDGRFFVHSEEIDLCWRLRSRGRDIYHVPDSQVYHVGGGTLSKNSPMKTFLDFRNNLTMLYKNLNDKDLKHVMCVRWWLDYLAALQMLSLGHHWGDFCVVFKARRAFKRWRHEYDFDRQKIQNSRLVQDEEILSPYSILWEYYVKRKKKYSEI